MVEPVHPFQGCQLQGFGVLPGRTSVNQFGLIQAVDCLCQVAQTNSNCKFVECGRQLRHRLDQFIVGHRRIVCWLDRCVAVLATVRRFRLYLAIVWSDGL